MRARIARERKTNKALEFLQSLGVQTEDISVTTALMVDNSPENKVLQAEASILFLQKPERFITKKCDWKECGEYFGTNYKSVAYCSNACRGKAFEHETGMRIDWSKSAHERWGGDPPLIVDPETLKNLAALMQANLRGTDPVRQDSPEEPVEPSASHQSNSEEVASSSPPSNPLPEPDLDSLLLEILG